MALIVNFLTYREIIPIFSKVAEIGQEYDIEEP